MLPVLPPPPFFTCKVMITLSCVSVLAAVKWWDLADSDNIYWSDLGGERVSGFMWCWMGMVLISGEAAGQVTLGRIGGLNIVGVWGALY